MNIIEMKLSDIIPYENNPRRNEEAVQYVANSIKEFGFKVPIIVDKENVIVAGHTRALAAEKLGIEIVPVIKADDLTEEQIRALRIADNKTAEIATWDNEALEMELSDLIEKYDMTEFGFGEFELSGLDGIDPVAEYGEERSVAQSSESTADNHNRVIITYTKADEERVCALLGLETITKSVYEMSELIERTEND